ncbi:MAG: hypothetical protein ABL951_02980 [Alphaproteobacteria bacterium]
MPSAKDVARQLIDEMPDNVTLDDIMYELYVKQKIEQGLLASRDGRVTPVKEVFNVIADKHGWPR